MKTELISNVSHDLKTPLTSIISYIDLLDMLTFDRAEFHKEIKLSVKKKVNIESKWELERLDKIADIIKGVTYSKADQSLSETNKIILTADNITLNGDFEIKKKVFINESFNIPTEKKLSRNDIFICFSSGSKEHLGKVAFIEENTNYFAGGFMGIVRVNKNAKSKYIYQLLNSLLRQTIRDIGTGSNINNLSGIINEVKIPLPPLDIQQKIVSEIEVLEAKEQKAKEEIENGKERIATLYNQAESKADKVVRLSDENIFQVSIGKRVLKNEFVENGKIPVYSANVIEPFGSIDKLLIKDFSKPSVLWGIDGDWMVNHLPKDEPFYPTDHCGVLRVKDNSINEKYLAFILEKEGKVFEFSRTKRASIDRIQGIKIAVPPLSEQQKFVSEIEKIEEQIKTLETEISEIPKQKEVILKKYL